MRHTSPKALGRISKMRSGVLVTLDSTATKPPFTLTAPAG